MSGPDGMDKLSSFATRVHPTEDIGATIASGSVPVAGMIVAPCSMRSLAAIAHGLDDNLLTRAASVQLKRTPPSGFAGARGAFDAGASSEHDRRHRTGGNHPATGSGLLSAPPICA